MIRTSVLLTPLVLGLGACATPRGAPPSSAVAPAKTESRWKDAAALEANAKGAVARIEALRAAIKAPGTPRDEAHVLEPYNAILGELDRGLGLAGLMANVHPDKAAREAAEAAEQALQKLANDINLDRGLYEAITAAAAATKLDPEADRFVDRVLRAFRRAGVDKDDATRERLRGIHDRMVKVGQAFDRNIREDVRTIELDDEKALAGLPDDFIRSHKRNAHGKIEITTNYPDYFPVETYARDEGLRRRLATEFLNRGFPKNDPLLAELLGLRAEYAKILGYPTWAEYQAEDKMVKSAKAIESFIGKVAEIARPRMERDLTQLLARKRKDDPGAKAIEQWDRFYYVDKVRA